MLLSDPPILINNLRKRQRFIVDKVANKLEVFIIICNGRMDNPRSISRRLTLMFNILKSRVRRMQTMMKI